MVVINVQTDGLLATDVSLKALNKTLFNRYKFHHETF